MVLNEKQKAIVSNVSDKFIFHFRGNVSSLGDHADTPDKILASRTENAMKNEADTKRYATFQKSGVPLWDPVFGGLYLGPLVLKTTILSHMGYDKTAFRVVPRRLAQPLFSDSALEPPEGWVLTRSSQDVLNSPKNSKNTLLTILLAIILLLLLLTCQRISNVDVITASYCSVYQDWRCRGLASHNVVEN